MGQLNHYAIAYQQIRALIRYPESLYQFWLASVPTTIGRWIWAAAAVFDRSPADLFLSGYRLRSR